MRVLGIGLSHCCGVCLIEHGRVVFAQEEDRFSRRRRHKGWPELSLAYVAETFGLGEDDIDLCVLCDEESAARLGRKINAKKTITVHHHLAHVMSGWALVDWDDFDSVSLDGGGDYGSWLSFGAVRDRRLVHWQSNCGTVLDKSSRETRRPWLRLRRPGVPFGTYWSRPAVLNFGMLDRNGVGGYEGKLMGLAGHGDADAFDAKESGYNARFTLKEVNDYHYIVTHGQAKLGDPHHVVLSDGRRVPLAEVRRLRKEEKVILCEYDLKHNGEDRGFAANFGAYLQRRTNEAVLEMFKRNFTADVPIVGSGGAFANVVTNGLLNQRYSLFVVPPMGDDGLALGAAAWGAYLCGTRYVECPDMFLGYDAGSNADVDPGAVADLLADDRIVGLIEGCMELGPRTLGARSILADPRDSNVNASLNERLGRVEYMPFAPVILEEHAADVLLGWRPEHRSSKHMTLLYNVAPKWAETIRGVVHVDGTVRPQVISREENPVYYDIVHEYYERTGIPVLVNTSFNAHGEPILRTVEHGLDALDRGRIDALVAGNRLILSEELPQTGAAQ